MRRERGLYRCAVLGLWVLGFGGCGAGQPSEPAGAAGAGVTYHQAVAPLLARHCVACHSEGQIAPFALDSYERAASQARSMATAVRERRMPPYPADNGGDCGSFHGARWLSEGEIATFEAWSAQGAPEGERTSAPEPTPLPELDGRVVRLDMSEGYLPDASKTDDYRCFLVNAAADEEELHVTGFNVRPGDARVVHHVIVYHPNSDEAAAQAAALDAKEEGPGYTCFGASGVLAGVVAAWAPGGGATFYPEGTGIRIKPHRPLILQLHYNTQAGVGQPDRSGVDLRVVSGGVTTGRFVPVADLGLRLPPHQSQAEAGASMGIKLPSGPARVHGVFPHMHTLGRSMRVELQRADASRSCIVDVPRWDFHWQMLYFHREPLDVGPGDTLSIRCSYDTRSRSEETLWGEGTADEMCVAGVFVVP